MKLAPLLCCAVLLGTVAWALDVSQMFELDETDKKDLCVDLVFILDWSCSVAYEDFDKMRLFVRRMVEGMKIGPAKSLVGVITFSDGAERKIGVGEQQDKDSLLQAIDDMFEPCKQAISGGRYKMSKCCDWSTETWLALRMARTDPKLLKNARVNVANGKNKARVTLTITDGTPRKRTEKVDNRGDREKGDSDEIPREEAIRLTIEEGKANKDAGIVSVVGMVKNSMELDDDKSDAVFEAISSDGTDNGLTYLFKIDDILADIGKVFRTIARYTCPDYCDKQLDVCFIMDKSLSITANNIEVVKQFFAAIAHSFDLGNILVGMVTYNDQSKEVFYLNKYSKSAVDGYIEGITTETDKYTQTHEALKHCRTMFDQNGRPGVAKVGILASDGVTWLRGANSEVDPAKSPARSESYFYKQKGYHILVIGEPNYIGKPGYPEWKLVATPPKNGNVDQHIYDMQSLREELNFQDLLSITGNLTRTICNLA